MSDHQTQVEDGGVVRGRGIRTMGFFLNISTVRAQKQVEIRKDS